MLRKIMVPLDGSPFAEQALPWALTLARRAHAELHLVRVRPWLPLGRVGTTAEQYLTRITGQLEPELPGLITPHVLTNEPGPVMYPAPAGSVAEILTDSLTDADLIVLTTHGRGGVRRAWLGSVADALVRISSTPVLLIRPEDESFGVAAAADRGVNHIVVPVDGSESAERVLPHVGEIAGLFNARCTLLRIVYPLIWDVTAEHYAAHAPPIPVFSRGAAEEYVEHLTDGLRSEGVQAMGAVVEALSAAAGVLDYAKTHGADLIALTTSGAGGIQRLLLGSVADKLVRSCDVPVLVFNVRQADAATKREADHAAGQAR